MNHERGNVGIPASLRVNMATERVGVVGGTAAGLDTSAAVRTLPTLP